MQGKGEKTRSKLREDARSGWSLSRGHVRWVAVLLLALAGATAWTLARRGATDRVRGADVTDSAVASSDGSSPAVSDTVPAPRSSDPSTATDPTPTRNRASVPSTTENLRGRVLDAEGSGIPGVRLGLHVYVHLEAVRTTLSDEDGRFVLEVPCDPAELYRVVARAAGWMPERSERVAPGATVELALRPAATLVGYVQDAKTGASVAGAAVSTNESLVSTTTDASGKFRIPCALDELTSLAIDAHGYLVHHEVVGPVAPGLLERNFELTPFAPLMVQVVDEQTEKPLRGAVVTVSGSRRATERTDAQGRFPVQLVEGPPIVVIVSKPGYAQLRWGFEASDAQRGLEPRIPMRELAVLQGVVLDSAGSPAKMVELRPRCEAHAEHRLEPASLAAHGLFGHVELLFPEDHWMRSGFEGEFQLPVLPCTGPHRLSVGGSGVVPLDVGPLVLDQPGQRLWIEVVVEQGARIQGRILHDGQPLGDRRGLLSPDLVVAFESEGGGRVLSESMWDPDHYAIEGAPPGDGRLVLLDADRGELVRGFVPHELSVKAGKSYEVDLHWEEALLPLEGRVVDSLGEGVRERWFRVSNSDPRRSTSTTHASTEPDGTFAVEVPAGERYDITFTGQHSLQSLEAVPAGTTDLLIVEETPGTLALQLVDAATGLPIPLSEESAPALLWRPRGPERFRPTGERSMRAPDLACFSLPPGTLDLQVQPAQRGFAASRLDGITIEAGRRTLQRVELQQAVSLTLKLTNDPVGFLSSATQRLVFLRRECDLNTPLELAMSSNRTTACATFGRAAQEIRDPTAELVTFDARGLDRVEGLAPGRYGLGTHPEDLLFEPAVFEVTAANPRVTLTWRRAP